MKIVTFFFFASYHLSTDSSDLISTKFSLNKYAEINVGFPITSATPGQPEVGQAGRQARETFRIMLSFI